MQTSLITISVPTKGNCDLVDITAEISQRLKIPGFREGLVTVFVAGSTAGLALMEYEPGLVQDMKRAFQRIAPADIYYDHNTKWGDGNGHSHVAASILGQSVTIPFSSSELVLGAWQQIVLVEFDNRPRQRHIYVKYLQG